MSFERVERERAPFRQQSVARPHRDDVFGWVCGGCGRERDLKEFPNPCQCGSRVMMTAPRERRADGE